MKMEIKYFPEIRTSSYLALSTVTAEAGHMQSPENPNLMFNTLSPIFAAEFDSDGCQAI